MRTINRWIAATHKYPVLSAWPFVLVLVIQTAVASFSLYTLSTIRAYITNETNWTRNETRAIYLLSRYFQTNDARYRNGFRQAIVVPLAYRRARATLDQPRPDLAVVKIALLEAGAAPADIPKLIWMFRNFRGVPFLETSISRWKATDESILALNRLGSLDAQLGTAVDAMKPNAELDRIEATVAPLSAAFATALNDGARTVEWLLALANIVFACLLAGLTTWRVASVLKQRRQIADTLMWQASHDELTGLANRRTLLECLTRRLELPKSEAMSGTALVFIDLDQFKVINDTCGHAAGDALLQQVCRNIQATLRSQDIFARFGGDEFNIVMPGVDAGSAREAAERIRATVEQTNFVWRGRRFVMTASIGMVHGLAGTTNPEAMISKADMACFMAKEKGRNRVHAYNDDDQELIERMREMDWVQRIHQAADEDRFCLYAQEIVPLEGLASADHRVEVLIRMRDENGCIVPPSSFLPAAERFGLMKVIDRWVVSNTFRILAARRSANEGPIDCCAINLSGATIGDVEFFGFLKAAFEEFDVSPQMICFEVTETSAIVNLDAARLFVQNLRDIGCAFSLDDFGTGMSSFNYLKELPVDFIKIDGSFVKNLMIDRADRAMVEMICHVGHTMGKKIVAECVELDSIFEALRDIGIDYGQGFGIAEPMPFTPHFRFAGYVPARRSIEAERLASDETCVALRRKA